MSTDAAYLAEDKGLVLLSTMWALGGLTTIFVAGRTFTRRYILQKPHYDDWFIGIALVLNIVYAALITAAVHAGYGKHASALPVPELERAIMLSVAGYTPGVFSFIFPKFAVVWVLIDLLQASVHAQCILWSLTGFAGLMILGCVIILFAQCDPPRALWTVTLMTAKCWSPWVLVDFAIVAGSISAMTDLVLAIYPIRVILNLQMGWKKKLALSMIMGLSAIASGFAIYKCTQLPSLADKSDYTYSTANLIIWTCVESNSITIAACITFVGPLIRVLLGKSPFSSKEDTPHYTNSYPLSDNPQLCRAGDRRKIRPGLHGTVTNVTSDDAESQESILRSRPDGAHTHRSERIRRTDEVTVEYESGD